MNKGIFVDIFPLYYLPKNKIIQELQKIIIYYTKNWIELYHWNNYNKLNPDKPKIDKKREKQFNTIKKMFSYSFLCKLCIFACNIRRRKSDYVGLLSFDCFEKRYIWSTSIFSETVDLPFMNGTIKAPKEWDEFLKHQYGDYMKIVKGSSCHSGILFDTEIPYYEKLSKKENIEDK